VAERKYSSNSSANRLDLLRNLTRINKLTFFSRLSLGGCPFSALQGLWLQRLDGCILAIGVGVV
jgi:hypothetical protein